MNAQMTGAPATKPQEPATAEGRFAAKYPELKASWDKASTGKEALLDFMTSVTTEDIANNPDAMKQYLALRYQGQDLDGELRTGPLASRDTARNINRVRKAIGLDATQTMYPGSFIGGIDGLFGLSR